MPETASAPPIETHQSGFLGRIPVRNLWLLMLYASDLFRARGPDLVGAEDDPDDLPDLVARILADAVEKRQRRQLSLAYQRRHVIVSRVRGRILALPTERHQFLSRGRVACEFDELTADTPRNRFVRAGLELGCRIVRRKDIAMRCASLAASMKAMGVSGEVPTRAEISRDRFGRNDADDRLMLEAAKLIMDLRLPTETSGSQMLPLPERELTWVRRLFEKAIVGFYDYHLTTHGWRVGGGVPLTWQIESKTEGIDRILPMMRTDVVLEHAPTSRRIVIDTKFTSILTNGWYRDETLRSGYLYQIYAYLRSQAGRGDVLADSASGLLLHPSVGEELDEMAVIQGHSIRFATVDLTGQASAIKARLLDMCPSTISQSPRPGN